MKSILLIEEDVEGRTILSKMLRQRGFLVMPAEHEAAALAVIDSGRSVDLVLAGATFRSRFDFLADIRTRRIPVPVVFLADHGNERSGAGGLLDGFSVSRKLNLYFNTRPIAFCELDRLIRIVPTPRGDGQTADFHAA
jgi:DNA-binding response OmpR family regulator